MRIRDGLLLSLGSALVAMPAYAQDAATFEYAVEAGDTCPKIAKKIYGDEKRIDLVHGANPQLGKPPHNLKEGQVLKLPRTAGAGGSDAKVTFVKNQVAAFTPAEHPAKRDEDLMRGHRVSTLASSSAEIMFASEATLQLGEHTLVVILGSTRGQVSKTAGDTTLVQGSLRARLGELAGKPASGGTSTSAPAPKEIAVSTQSGHKIQVTPSNKGNGETKVSVDDKQATRVAVYEGQSSFRAQNKEVSVPRGFGSKAEKATPPSTPKPLPPAPVWASAPPKVVLTNGVASVIAGTYAAGTGPGPAAATWHVQVSRDALFNDTIVDTTVGVAVTNLEARDVPPGTYYARVSAVDSDAFEGLASDVVKIDVVAPKLVTTSTRQAQIDVPPGLFCGVDGAPLTETKAPISVRRGRMRTLRCAGSADAPESAMATWTLPAQSIGRVVAKLDGAPVRAGDVVTARFLLVDSANEPLDDAEVSATTSDAARVESTTRVAPGIYEVRVRPASGRASTRVAFVVNGIDRSEAVAIDEDHAQPAANDSPFVIQGALLAGAGFSTDDLGVGSAFGVEAAVRYAMAPRLSLGVAGRLSFERYTPESERAACGTSPSPSLPGCSGTYTYAVDVQLFGLGLPITARYDLDRLHPYVGLAPMAIFERSTTEIITNTSVLELANNPRRFALHGFVGADWTFSGKSGAFVEVGYRRSSSATRNGGEFSLGAVLTQAGFRVVF